MTEAILLKLLELSGIPLIMLIIGYLIGRYLKPWVHANQERLAKAQEIAFIVDRLTDEFLREYPNIKPLEWLDKAIDKAIKACDLKDADENKEILKREFTYSLTRKGIKLA